MPSETLNFLCSRCGRCCVEFANQIHFTPEEKFITSIFDHKNPKINSLINLFHIHKDKFKKEIGGKIRYYIPSKKRINELSNGNLEYFSKSFSKNMDECMFLDWINISDLKKKTSKLISNCLIHEYNPRMCNEYPTSKGNVCKNHPENKYSRIFFKYQKNKIGFAIKVLKELYSNRITNEICFNILTILMDFGKFDFQLLQNFLLDEFEYSIEDFQESINILKEYNLISLINNNIEGISLKETEIIIDQLIKERGW